VTLEDDIFQTAHEVNLRECERNGIFSRRYDTDYGACIYYVKPLCPYKIISKHKSGETHLCSRWLERGVRAVFRRVEDQYK